jgi:hypothetical protein
MSLEQRLGHQVESLPVLLKSSSFKFFKKLSTKNEINCKRIYCINSEGKINKYFDNNIIALFSN